MKKTFKKILFFLTVLFLFFFGITAINTFDSAVLAADFCPESDTIIIKYYSCSYNDDNICEIWQQNDIFHIDNDGNIFCVGTSPNMFIDCYGKEVDPDTGEITCKTPLTEYFCKGESVYYHTELGECAYDADSDGDLDVFDNANRFENLLIQPVCNNFQSRKMFSNI
ncbi:MAG: hypothetical protein CEN87_542 [Parcubacteria group bacterium Licking1014_1]|nr:MAG: hypothetical protein CEN87_542 [Parcubacteria group bacterium Licking1014_1]